MRVKFIKISATYLMACNAFKRGSLKVNCEDVIAGYTLTLKLLTEDIREYVIKYSDGDEVFLNTNFENQVDINNNQEKTSSVNKKIAFVFATLAFIEVLCLIGYVQHLFAPDLQLSDNQLLRLSCLIICFLVAHKFYNYLTDGNDGKTKSMISLIIILLITIYGSYIIP